MRQHHNFLDGTITDAPLTAGATSINAAILADLPALAAGDYYALVLDPLSENGAPEIVYATAHAAGATVVTGVLRGMETGHGGGVAREHPAGTRIVHAPIASDAPAIVGGASQYDDNFDDDAIDGDWIQVNEAGGPAVVWTEKGKRLSLYHPGGDQTSEFHGLMKPMGALAPPMSIEISYQMLSTGHYIMTGPCFSDGIAYGAGNQLMAMDFGATEAYFGLRAHTGWNTQTADHGSVAVYTGRGAVLHQRLTWVAANTFKHEVSIDGVSWLDIYGANKAWNFTPTHMGIAVSSWGGVGARLASIRNFKVIE